MNVVGRILISIDQALRESPNFGALLSGDDRYFLLSHGVVRTAGAGEVLCRQHEHSHSAFILMAGEVEVTEQAQGQVVTLARLGPGQVFGEIAALLGAPRLTTATTSRPSVWLEIPGEVLKDLMDRASALCSTIFHRYQGRAIEVALRAVPLFRHVSEEAWRELTAQASLVEFAANQTIVEEGEPGDALYIVNYGAAYVRHVAGGKRLNLAVLRPGDYFGEWSLLTGAPRAATVTALTRVEAVRLECQPFLAFIQRYPAVRDSVDLVAHQRHAETLRTDGQPESQGRVKVLLSEIEQILGGQPSPASRGLTH